MENGGRNSYEFVFFDGAEKVYAFTTFHQAVYSVRFKPSFYLLDADPVFANHVYELIIALVEKPPKQIPPDERIYPTIAAIVGDFFLAEENSFVYVCDDWDGKGRVRKRKFDGWFYYQSADVYEKFDKPFTEPDGFRYYASIVCLAKNPLKRQIFDAFDALGDRYTQK
jgi:hypothetical protein